MDPTGGLDGSGRGLLHRHGESESAGGVWSPGGQDRARRPDDARVSTISHSIYGTQARCCPACPRLHRAAKRHSKDSDVSPEINPNPVMLKVRCNPSGSVAGRPGSPPARAARGGGATAGGLPRSGLGWDSPATWSARTGPFASACRAAARPASASTRAPRFDTVLREVLDGARLCPAAPAKASAPSSMTQGRWTRPRFRHDPGGGRGRKALPLRPATGLNDRRAVPRSWRPEASWVAGRRRTGHGRAGPRAPARRGRRERTHLRSGCTGR